jgi:hypothetical protein
MVNGGGRLVFDTSDKMGFVGLVVYWLYLQW